MDYLQRFSLTHHVFPQNAHGESFFETPSYPKLKRRFQMLSREPGLGILVADVGVGKTSAIRNLCHALPRPDFRVVYLCDTAVSPLDLYRQLAVEIGLTPSHRRAQNATGVNSLRNAARTRRGSTGPRRTSSDRDLHSQLPHGRRQSCGYMCNSVSDAVRAPIARTTPPPTQSEPKLHPQVHQGRCFHSLRA